MPLRRTNLSDADEGWFNPAGPSLPLRDSKDYPFPTPPTFVSDRATRKIDEMFKERNCARVIKLDRKMRVLSDHV